MMKRNRQGGSRAILAIGLALLIIGASVGIWQYSKPTAADAAAKKEAALRLALTEIRDAIRDFHAANQRYPRSLDELVPIYLSRIPPDPITGSADTWVPITEETVSPDVDFQEGDAPAGERYLLDVKSGAGQPWSEY
jgi:type II secretory pathway pseudopilin PulG